MPTIDYYFTSISPFTYLGHKAFEAMARKHGCAIAYKPFNLGQIFENSGALPLAKRPPVRQRYRLLELQRIAEYRNLPINLKPAYFPADPTLADQCAIALVKAEQNPADFIWKALSGVWANNENVADEAVLSGYLSSLGQHVASILDFAKSEVAASLRAENTRQAIAADAVGSPAYVLNGEVFWGQDRIDLLEHALETGRPPFKAP
jgi:2-hydroxychromene-2-carboxylate isomerase